MILLSILLTLVITGLLIAILTDILRIVAFNRMKGRKTPPDIVCRNIELIYRNWIISGREQPFELFIKDHFNEIFEP